MYPITNAVKALFDAEQRQVLRITGTDKNNTAISITEANVMEGGFNIDRFSCNGTKLEIGTACSAELTLKLDNRQGQFNGIVFEGAELFVEIGIADWTQTNPTVTYIPCGYFTPDEQPRSLSTITVKALDRMMNFDAAPPALIPWTDQSDNIITDSNGNQLFFLSNVTFPSTVENIIKHVSAVCGVPFIQDLSSLPNYNYTVSAMPDLQQEATFRNIIQWCAGIMGTNAWIDWNGNLVFSWYGASTGYTMTTANRFSSDLHEDDITITGVKYTNTDNETVYSGTSDYVLDMTGNYLAEAGISTILPNVKNAVNGFTYRPFTASVINAPYLWPMDIVTFTDKDNNNHTSALTNVNFTINGTTELQSIGETDQANKRNYGVGVTSEQWQLIESAGKAASEAVQQLDNNLTQQEIFDRLTDGGQTQGISLEEVLIPALGANTPKKIYLNVDFVNDGTMSFSHLRGETLRLGGINNANGEFAIYDASGNLVGTWDNQSLKLGSNNNYVQLYGPTSDPGQSGQTVVVPLLVQQAYNNNNVRVMIYRASLFIDDGTNELWASPSSIKFMAAGSGEPNLQVSDQYFSVFGGDYTFEFINGGDLIIGADNVDILNGIKVNGVSGASGSFTTKDNKTVTVTNGIITRIA